MTPQEKLAFRAAEEIHDQYWRMRQGPATLTLPAEYWAKAQTLVGQIERAAQHGWQGAVVQLRRELQRELENCRDRLDRVINTLQTPAPPIPSLADIYQEISSLAQEFENWQIDIKNHELVVTTERIVLEGVLLGDFEIRLDWEQLDGPTTYSVVALDPHPPAANEDVTHPHVQSQRLCEGDGRQGIQNALQQGRLADFFLIVAQLLHTYAKGSAFVELDDWEGVFCDDCGGSACEFDRYYCNHCDATLCSSCSRTCPGCESSFCSYCLKPCAICNDDYCSHCLDPCKECHRNVCSNCLIHGLCEECHAKRNPSNEAGQSTGYESKVQANEDPSPVCAETCPVATPLGV